MRLAFVLALTACNSEPLYLPEPDMKPILMSHAIVPCNTGECQTGQACCTHDDGILGSCVQPNTDPGICYALIQCDGPEDCPGAICCDSQARFNGTSCTDSCDDVYSTPMCHTDDDCPASAAHCCPRSPSGPLQHCLPFCWT